MLRRSPASRPSLGPRPAGRSWPTPTACSRRWPWCSRQWRGPLGSSRPPVVTLQALSGAGFGGLNAVETAGNVIPCIRGEEDEDRSRAEQDPPGRHRSRSGGQPDAGPRRPHRSCLPQALPPSVSPRCDPGAKEFRPAAVLSALPTLPARPLIVRTELHRPQAPLGRGRRSGDGGHRRADPAGLPPPHNLALAVVARNGIRVL